jgi:hypothetical protein
MLLDWCSFNGIEVAVNIIQRNDNVFNFMQFNSVKNFFIQLKASETWTVASQDFV